MPTRPPHLDQASLTQLGRELQAAHHKAEPQPLPDQQRDLLLEWAVREAVEAALAKPSGDGGGSEGVEAVEGTDEKPGMGTGEPAADPVGETPPAGGRDD